MLLLNGTINIIEKLSEKTYPYFTHDHGIPPVHY